MKKVELSQKQLIIIIVCAVLIVALVVTCLIAANVGDKSRFKYELKADGTYKIVDLKNSYRGGWFAKKSITIPTTYKKTPVTEIERMGIASIEEIIIPEGITTIATRAFANGASIKTVKLPSTLTSIGNGAFANCSKLTEIEIPESVRTIAKDTFSNCYELTNIKLSSKTVTIADSAFSGCAALESINLPTTIKTIGANAFANSGLKSITIPQNVTTVSKGVFSGCANLTNVTISNSTEIIEEEAFKDCQLLATLNIPDTVTSVSSNTFDNCAQSLLKTHDNGLYIGNSDNAYAILVKLTDNAATSLTLNDNTLLIANNAFSSNSALTTVTTNNGLKIIGNNAFNNCQELNTVVIADSVEIIRDNAFANCSKLLNVTKNGAPFAMGSTTTSLNAFVGTAFFRNIAKANKGFVIDGDILFGIDNDILATSFKLNDKQEYNVYLSLQDKENNKLTKLRLKAEEKNIVIYTVTGEPDNEKETRYLSVAAKYTQG